MQLNLNETKIRRKPIDKLPVVSNFRKVIEKQDICHMKKELYEFFHLHCGFIAHFDINGFKATYSRPEDFTEVFMRHFDREHRYFDGAYKCHENSYKQTGYTKAQIKKELFSIVDKHKESIVKWVQRKQKDERYALYLKLRKEFDAKGIGLHCEACGNVYEIKVFKDEADYRDFQIICCLFCGQQIKLNHYGGDTNVESTEQKKIGQTTEVV